MSYTTNFIHAGRDQYNYNITSKPDPIQSLPQAKSASFDTLRVCLPRTREKLLEETWSWIDSIDDSETERVFWITGVAGAGKSAVAHTIAHQCRLSQRHHSSCFFFDRGTDGRNNPDKLFSTIVHDLASRSPDIHLHVGTVLESNPTLASAPISRQFEELLCGLKYEEEMPVVIVIDAVDEGRSSDLLQILRDGMQKLHKKFRIIITSRPVDSIVSNLSNVTHIRRKDIDICDPDNLDDITLYSHHRLEHVAEVKRLKDWLNEKLMNAFIAKAEGLFIWVSVVASFLENISCPAKKLDNLLSKRSTSRFDPEIKMAELYKTVLEECNPGDEDFIAGYQFFIGAIIAVKEPVSLDILDALHFCETDLRAGEILSSVASLLSSVDVDLPDRPIRLIHLSLREFLTSRDQGIPWFYLDPKYHNERLALLCQTVLTRDLLQSISDVTKHPALWYACRFWIDHIVEVDDPHSKVIEALQKFLTTKVMLWAKLMVSQRAFRKLSDSVQVWIKKLFPQGHPLDDAFGELLADKLAALSERLYKEKCYDKAVEAAEDSEQIYRFTIDRLRSGPNVELKLVYTLINLAKCRARLGYHTKSFKAAHGAVELCQSLSATKWGSENLREIDGRRAHSLNYRAKSLSHIERSKEALADAREAVRIFRVLAEQRLAKNDRELAYSLGLQARCLCHCHGYQEALSLLSESEGLYRTLGLRSSLDYAHCLRDISRCLSHLKRLEDAYRAADESLSVHWKLKDIDPDTFHLDDFTTTLMVVAYCLTCLEHHEEALNCMYDAVEMRRELSKNNLASTKLNLGISLCQLADCLHNSGSHDKAAMLVAEAEALRRRLGFDLEHKRDIVSNLATALSSLDRRLEYYKSRKGDGVGQETGLYDSCEA